MNIAFLFPPLKRKYATCGQNRQFQYFNEPFFAYPLMPARIATYLQNQGHKVDWIDCISNPNAKMDYTNYDKVYIEVKYPIAQEIYNMNIPNAVYYGDIENDPIDYNTLPWDIDRLLTQWWLYAYDNGNYRKLPGTYIQSAQDCRWGKCSFCSWGAKYRNYRVRDYKDVLGEVRYLKSLGVKEIMDDAGTFPYRGDTLAKFCEELPNITYNCNMRFGELGYTDYCRMKKAGFRMLLFGVESCNDETLKKINKGVICKEIIEGCMLASKAGLDVHLTVMYGYPWESQRDAENTLHTIYYLLTQGYASSVQATLVIPYPNTPLYKQALDYGWLLTQDLTKYDMSQPVLVTSYDPMEFAKRTYRIAFNPFFLWRKIRRIRTYDDIKFYYRTLKKVRGHLNSGKCLCSKLA